jgi:hypothetical protein
MVLECYVEFEGRCVVGHRIIVGCRCYAEAVKQQNCTATVAADLPMGAIVEAERCSETPGAFTDNAGDRQSIGH